MYAHLVSASAGRPFDLEVSVDETDTPTTPAEHLYVASEMKRLGVQWVSLAPRFVGRFEKGVDYIGDVALFEREFAVHAAIARHVGPYKLSLHSGSDKFSIYGIAARLARGLVHLKTAGTSYLEALRALSVADARRCSARSTCSRASATRSDKQTYHVSAELGRAPAPETLDRRAAAVAARAVRRAAGAARDLRVGADQAPGIAERFRTRAHRAPGRRTTRASRTHFKRHLEPFAAGRHGLIVRRRVSDEPR